MKEKIYTLCRKIKIKPVNMIFKIIFQTIKYIEITLVCIFSNSFFNFFVVIFQLFLGAMIGAKLGSIIGSNSEYVFYSFSGWTLFWKDTAEYIKVTIYFVLFISFLKAYADTRYMFKERKSMQKRLEQERLLPAENYFVTTYPKAVKEALEQGRLIDQDEDPLVVVNKILELVRELASKYESLQSDTISANLMVTMRVDESKQYIEKNWDNIFMFFDGSNADSACSQIDAVLVPFAVSHEGYTENFVNANNRGNRPKLYLPLVENDSEKKTKQRVIGAPEAFFTNHYQYYPDFLRSVNDWLFKEQKRHINKSQADLLYEYYFNDSSARSLLSIPINAPYPRNGSENNEPNTLAVLNIYARHNCLLRGNPTIYISLIEPLLDTLSYALDFYFGVNEREPENSITS